MAPTFHIIICSLISSLLQLVLLVPYFLICLSRPSPSSCFCLLQVFPAGTCRCPLVAPLRDPSSSLTSRPIAGSCLHILSDPATNPCLLYCHLCSLCEEPHCFISKLHEVQHNCSIHAWTWPWSITLLQSTASSQIQNIPSDQCLFSAQLEPMHHFDL